MYETLADVIVDSLFVKADLELRRGSHISASNDIFLFNFLVAAQHLLEPFYDAYRVQLILGSEGYFYLLPDHNVVPPPLGSHKLSILEMLAGQTIALMRLDPKWLATNGRIPELSILELMEHILGQERLLGYVGRKRGRDRENEAKNLREQFSGALRTLKGLGFIQREGKGSGAVILPQTAIMRFADPVRGRDSFVEALERLIRDGEIEHIGDDGETNDADVSGVE